MSDVVVITTMLSEVESSALAGYERTIDAGLGTFYEVGNALLVIREQRLYRGTHGTWESYIRERWGMSDRHARRLVDAAVVVDDIRQVTGPMGPVPTSERQARELVDLEPTVAAEVMNTVMERHARPTAAVIRQARDEVAPTRSQTAGGRQSNPRRRPLTDDFRTLAVDVNKMLRKVEKLLADDRLDRNAGYFAHGHGADLRRLDDALVRLMVRTGVAE